MENPVLGKQNLFRVEASCAPKEQEPRGHRALSQAALAPSAGGGGCSGLSRAALPQQGTGCSFPVPWEAPLSCVGTECGIGTQPCAGAQGQSPRRDEPLWGIPSPASCPGAAAGLHVENMDFSTGALSWTPALTASVHVPGNRNHQCLL